MKRIKLVHGSEPPELSGDGHTFVLIEKTEAELAANAMRAKTWGQFAKVVELPLDSILQDWGEEIVEAYGKMPIAEDAFSFSRYWGAWYFADMVTDPRQAAFEAVINAKKLKNIFEGLEFDMQYGTPLGHIECICFRDESIITRLLAACAVAKPKILLSVEKDQSLVRDSLPH